MPTVILPARQCGKSNILQTTIVVTMLNALFDRGAGMSILELETRIRCTRHDLWTAIRQQHALGNVRKGQIVTLTPSAHIAIAAGRLAGGMAVAA